MVEIATQMSIEVLILAILLSIAAFINDSGRAAEAAGELFGAKAATAVAYCALQARTDERNEDYKFWFETFCRLTGLPSMRIAH